MRNLIVDKGTDSAATAEYSETVIKEFAAIGKYRVRVVENDKTKVRKVDIREWAKTAKYDGPTKKGIRLTKAELQQLFRAMGEIGISLGAAAKTESA
jgi:hypothetical protein